MNGGHDLGGMHGLGPVEAEPGEPPFHEEWERRAFALTLAMGFHGAWNIDASRHARENRHPVDYLSSSYYELWLKGLERLLAERGIVDPAEIGHGHAAGPRPEGMRPAHDPETAAAILARGGDARRDGAAPPRFRPGDRVLVRERAVPGHTRAPRYCRGRVGTVDRDHGGFVLPDTNAHGLGEAPQHCYSVRFAARTLWGEAASPHDAVYVDLWDGYLEPAP
ncbi:nitrile hydratase subunit beta [Arenibaculum sp.]|uniref:nitrile hydratase subunit beta n=1 Tax=Arenibaculum sp. TaxID=2865862 RepID=UPI002E12773F|nr:nitrile hydratase subunit beta [Arenibaculum sp.]